MKRSTLLIQLNAARALKKEIDTHVSCLNGKIEMCKRKKTRLENFIAVFNPDKKLRDPRKITNRASYIPNLEKHISTLEETITMYETNIKDLLDQSNTVFAA